MNNQELLDLFAAQAMTAIISLNNKTNLGDAGPPIYAKWAYEYAQAMMEERKKHLIPQTTEHITN